MKYPAQNGTVFKESIIHIFFELQNPSKMVRALSLGNRFLLCVYFF